jgi:hypothetical protein
MKADILADTSKKCRLLPVQTEKSRAVGCRNDDIVGTVAEYWCLRHRNPTAG